MSMNEKQVVGESFEDLSDKDLAMLTGRGVNDAAPASTPISTVTIPLSPLVSTTVSISLASANHYHGTC